MYLDEKSYRLLVKNKRKVINFSIHWEMSFCSEWLRVAIAVFAKRKMRDGVAEVKITALLQILKAHL